MKTKVIKPTDIQFTSSGCIIFGTDSLTDEQLNLLLEEIESYVKGKYKVITEDNFIELNYSLKPPSINKSELSKALSEAINKII